MTVKDIFKKYLSKDLAELAYKRTSQKLKYREINEKVMDLPIALSTCFDWQRSMEGKAFWQSIYDKAMEVKKLNKKKL